MTELASSPFAAGGEPISLAVDPRAFVYVANASSGDVSVLAITTGSGALSAVSGSLYAAGSQPSALAISR